LRATGEGGVFCLNVPVRPTRSVNGGVKAGDCALCRLRGARGHYVCWPAPGKIHRRVETGERWLSPAGDVRVSGATRDTAKTESSGSHPIGNPFAVPLFARCPWQIRLRVQVK
jgi:hypothetical protein